jgi:Dolichyl-phosphate-mannose-protein mannosyltransferase
LLRRVHLPAGEDAGDNQHPPERRLKESGREKFGPAIVLALAAAKLVFHLLIANRYGVFRDELYYLACSEHLDAGYVDQPPVIAFVAWIARHVFGESLIGLRFLPAVAGAATVWLTGKLARDLGGGAFAQALAALATFAAPVFLLMHHWLTMNAFEPLIWLACAWCVVRAINREQPRYWLWFGVLIGVGMENKYSTAFFAFAVVGGLFLTPQRRFLANRWIWIGAACSLLIFLPNLIWLIRHDFPFLELMHNIRSTHRDVVRGPIAFIADQAMLMNPSLFPLWAGGVLWLLLGRGGSRFRILGWIYALLLAAFIVLKGKNYYLGAAYPMLFAAGAVAFENLSRARMRWSRPVYVVLIVIVTCLLAPLSVPILSPENYIRYQKALGLEPLKAENQPTGLLPQHFADEFGWEEMARETGRVYNALPPEQRAKTAIFANSYGQAGAIDFFGKKYGVPKSISNHQSYWLWGPRDYTGETVIVLGSDGKGDREHFASVEVAGHTDHPYSRRDEHFDIFLCRDLNTTLQKLWPKAKKWN